MSEDKLRVKFVFKEERIQNERGFIECMLVNWRKLSLFGLSSEQAETGHELLRKHTRVSTNSVQVKYTYKMFVSFYKFLFTT
jgi:hypothetical protein